MGREPISHSMRIKLAKAREANRAGEFVAQCKRFKIPAPEREYVFAKPRKFPFDFAWPDAKIALESDGGLFINGGHNRGAHILKTHEKLNLAAAKGWRVFYTTPDELTQLRTLRMIGKELGVEVGEIGSL